MLLIVTFIIRRHHGSLSLLPLSLSVSTDHHCVTVVVTASSSWLLSLCFIVVSIHLHKSIWFPFRLIVLVAAFSLFSRLSC